MSCLGKNHDYGCKILLLDDTEIPIEVQGNVKGSVVLQQIFRQLNLIETDYFGLRFLDDENQTQWLDPAKSIKSQVKVGYNITFYFGVKFYAADPCNLREEITRYQFFLQVKKDILTGRLPVTFDQAAELSAFAVQSELGDYDPRRHPRVLGKGTYVSEFRFIPNQSAELEDRIMKIHPKLAGMVPSVAENSFLDYVKWLDMYGVDLHPVLGDGSVEYFLGLTPTAIVVYKNRTKVGNYFWPRIVKVLFKGKTFMIRVRDKNNDENTYAFDLINKNACKHLWKCSVEHHAFFRLSHVGETNASNLLNFGSKYRYSGRTERQALNDMSNHNEQGAQRTPSRKPRHSVGSTGTHTDYDAQNGYHDNVGNSVQKIVVPEPVKTPTKLAYPDSPRSQRSAPWEAEDTEGGLYTSGKDSPYSVHSDKMKFPRRIPSGSESEKSDRRGPRQHRSRHDEDGNARRRRRRSKEKENNGDSDYSESSNQRRRNRHRHSRDSSSMAVNDGWHDQRRHRSKSGERRKSPNRVPDEVLEHIQYELVDPDILTDEQRRDIPYIAVASQSDPRKNKYSPHSQSRHRSPHHRSRPNSQEVRPGAAIPIVSKPKSEYDGYSSAKRRDLSTEL